MKCPGSKIRSSHSMEEKSKYHNGIKEVKLTMMNNNKKKKIISGIIIIILVLAMVLPTVLMAIM